MYTYTIMVKWTLGSITVNKASGGDGIPAELFPILKDDAVKVLHLIPGNLKNSAVATRLKKVSFHSNLKERQCQRMFKLLYNCTHFTCEQFHGYIYLSKLTELYTLNGFS